MFELMEEGYQNIDYEHFVRDLEPKNLAGLLRDNEGTVQGFSTMSINPKGSGTEGFNIIYSGDTIISARYRGTQELVRGFCRTCGVLLGLFPEKKLYWYLISKGHRTYMYLPLFTREYFPARGLESESPLGEIARHCSEKLYGPFWVPEKGLLIFPESRGELKPELARDTYEKKRNKHVAYFLERNPGFVKGDELVCITDMSPQNLRGGAKRYLTEGTRLIRNSQRGDQTRKDPTREILEKVLGENVV